MLQPQITVDAWVDLGSLDCYLAVHSLRSSMQSLPFADRFVITLRPYLQDRSPHMTVEAELAHLSGNIDVLAREEGIRLDLTAELPRSTKLAQQLVLHAVQDDETSGRAAGPNTLSLRLTESIMRALFELGGDIQNPEVLIGIAQDLQIEGKRASDALRDELLSIEVGQAYELGLYLGVSKPPVFIFDDAFVVQGFQKQAAFMNILTTIWNEQSNRGETE